MDGKTQGWVREEKVRNRNAVAVAVTETVAEDSGGGITQKRQACKGGNVREVACGFFVLTLLFSEEAG